MKRGDLVKMKGPKTVFSWRQGYSAGIGVIIEEAHQTSRTMRGCTVLWSDDRTLVDIPEDWLEAI
ncbi:MAG: hypothetical protein VYD37_07095 [Gemmatimonadota bacterium]|nr:hypothetical protein [Gemmatimonadota bacterium]